MTNINDGNDVTMHAVLVPFPVQGHVNTFIQLADLLAVRGVFITFVNTEWAENRMFGSGKQNSQKPNFRFMSFPDGLPPEHGRTSQLGELLTTVAKQGDPLEAVLGSSESGKGNGAPLVTCIVTDSSMSCTVSVAANMRLPRVVFSPLCAAASIADKFAPSLVSQGHIPIKVSDLRIRPEKMITSLPGNIPPLRPRDLITFYREQFISDLIYEAFLFESRMSDTGDYVLVNTFDELEGREAAAVLSINGCPSLAIGPVFLPNFLREEKSTVSNISMWEEDDGCLQWLDEQRPRMVLYVSFGSLALKSQEQLDELALGLEQTGHAFLWVLRADIAEGQPAVVPEGFEERTKAQALIVKWAPQVKVLAHPSVGGFLTHSGWNSTGESISMGVPMIGWPYFGDQFLNCRFTKEVWKVGLDFEEGDDDDGMVVRREEIKSAVVRLMESEELQKKAQELKEAATKAVMAGGSSFNNITTFINDMLKTSRKNGNNMRVTFVQG